MSLEQELVLIKNAQAGDRQALSQLWDFITPKLFGYLVNTLKDKALAEDILQTTWLKAIKALPGFKSQGISISAWLFAIARNECKQHWRKDTREDALNENLHDAPNTDGQQTEQNILIEQMLAKLSPEDQELIRLRYISDLSIKDIAKVLNINLIAVRVRLHRAISKARTAIKS